MKNKIKLSIIMPAIRKERWDKAYNSILASTTCNFELIIVGPYPPTDYLSDKVRVKYIKDLGTPARAHNIGALIAEGDLVCWTSDDGLFLPENLDKLIEEYESMPANLKNVVVAKYYEGVNYSSTNQQNDEYYKIGFSDATRLENAKEANNWYLFNFSLFKLDYFFELGGLDCQFQACPMAHADFGVRAQADGAIVKMSEHVILNCDHMPGETGDHGPIHNAQVFEDQPLFKLKYENGLDEVDLKIDINNWKNSDSPWEKRYQATGDHSQKK
jgi:glycosyltransferase involved in cell wall biosynthesis